MIRTVIFFVVAAIVLGLVLAPGLAAVSLVLVPLAVLGFIWRIALAVTTRGHATDAIAQTQSRSFLGPGGPDDPFAAELSDERGPGPR
jgi:hypothetical protein